MIVDYFVGHSVWGYFLRNQNTFPLKPLPGGFPGVHVCDLPS